MEMPKPQEEHRRLEKLAGNWVGEEKIYPGPWDPQGGSAAARIETRSGLDGFFMITDYTETRGDQVSYRGHGVHGYDPNEKCFIMFWFDSLGSCGNLPAKGTWEGNRLVYTNKTPMGHSRYSYDFQGEGRYRFMIEMSQDGKQWAPMMEAQYTRK